MLLTVDNCSLLIPVGLPVLIKQRPHRCVDKRVGGYRDDRAAADHPLHGASVSWAGAGKIRSQSMLCVVVVGVPSVRPMI